MDLFLLAKVRERQCYAQAGLSRLVNMMDGMLSQVDPALAASAKGSGLKTWRLLVRTKEAAQVAGEVSKAVAEC